MDPEPLPYHLTYVGRLKAAFPRVDFIHHGRNGASISGLYEHCNSYREALAPDLVIMQSGVVDCAPRALTLTENMVINRISLARALLGPLVRRYSPALRRIRKIRYTTPERFRATVNLFEAAFPKVCWIGIPPADPQWERKVTGITDSVNLFNGILAEKDYISTEHLGRNEIMSDYHHLNVSGHEEIFKLLQPRIQEILSQKEKGLRPEPVRDPSDAG